LDPFSLHHLPAVRPLGRTLRKQALSKKNPIADELRMNFESSARKSFDATPKGKRLTGAVIDYRKAFWGSMTEEIGGSSPFLA
jgi:hypothetical protein